MKKTNRKKLGNKGFSLVELIVVIAIMAILVGVLAPSLLKNIEKSRESKDISNLDTIYSAMVNAYADEKAAAAVTEHGWQKFSFTATDDFTKEVLANMGTSTAITFSSKAAKGGLIWYRIETNGKVSVLVSASGASTATPVTSNYSNSFAIE